jgi:SAM-dependent methyltransferase
VRSFWHPLSTLLLVDPPCFATTTLVRLMLGAAAELELRYAGDRMGAAAPHGSRLTVRPADPGALEDGEVVVASVDGIPDLMRVDGRAEGRLLLSADADPSEPIAVPLDALLARTLLPRRLTSPTGRRRGRLSADLREATSGRPDPAGDPAETVQQKYDSQAVFYARSPDRELESGLAERLRECVPKGGRVLVIGSGSGKECFALAAAGWCATGLDFAPAMVAAAREEATRRGVDVEFVAGDARTQEFPEGHWHCVLFSYDVYSFVPRRAEREKLLRHIRGWLAPEGVVLLSARILHRVYERGILTLQRIAGPGGAAEWGDSHTRWISSDGELRRSFVRYFSRPQLAREIRAAGFRLEGWRDAHGILRPDCYDPRPRPGR